MNVINFNQLKILTTSFGNLFNESLKSNYQKKILAVALVALTLTAMCLRSLINRKKTFKSKSENLPNPIKVIHVSEEAISKDKVEIRKEKDLIRKAEEEVAKAKAEINQAKIEINKAKEEAIKAKDEVVKFKAEALNAKDEAEKVTSKLDAFQKVVAQTMKTKNDLEYDPEFIKKHNIKMTNPWPSLVVFDKYKEKTNKFIKSSTTYSIYSEDFNPSFKHSIFAIKNNEVLGFISKRKSGKYYFTAIKGFGTQKKGQVETELLLHVIKNDKEKGKKHLQIKGEFELKEYGLDPQNKQQIQEKFQKKIDFCEFFKKFKIDVKYTLENDQNYATLEVDFDLTNFELPSE